MKYVITIGGGTGTFNLVSALKKIHDVFINSIVTMSDDGGSTGILRDEYGILPPGDLRRALVALADENKSKFLRELFSYRFKDGFLQSQNLGNLIMFASEDILHDYGKALNELENLFEITRGKVFPSTFEKTRLLAQLEDGQYIIGETNIDIPKHNGNIKIKDFWVIKEKYAKILNILKDLEKDDIFYSILENAKKDKTNQNPYLEKIIKNADFIIFGPGDLYTSILPNLLLKNTIDIIKSSKAKKIFICNLFTKFGETNNYKLSNFLNIFKKFFGKDIFDYLLIQDESKLNIPYSLLEKYNSEGKELVKNDIKNDKKIIIKDLVSSGEFLRHDIEKLSFALKDIIYKYE